MCRWALREFFFRDLNTKDIIISFIHRINRNLLCGFMFRLPADGRSSERWVSGDYPDRGL